MAQSSLSNSPTHNILFTIPRTASNLINRILDLPNQPSISRHPRDGYFFLPALGYRYSHHTFSRPINDWTGDEQQGMHLSLQASLDTWKKWVEDADLEGKGSFIKEHINWMIEPEVESNFLYNSDKTNDGARNPTCIPDAFLFDKIRPTFLIRHPALIVPSLVRTALDLEGIDALLTRSSEKTMQWETAYHWHIMLYQFLLDSPTYPSPSHDPDIRYPIIIDASDLSNSALVRKYAAAVGLDPQVVQFEWNMTGDEGAGKMEARMKDTLLRSNGVMMEKLAGCEEMDLDVMKEEWKMEFGDVLGERVVSLVKGAMADYEWLAQRRMRV